MLNHLPVPGIVETSAANRDYKPGFAAGMMHKDLKLSQAAPIRRGSPRQWVQKRRRSIHYLLTPATAISTIQQSSS